MKKLTSERLGRESLAAWEDRKSNQDSATDTKETTLTDTVTNTDPCITEPDELDTEKPSPQTEDEETQTQRGS